MQPCALCWHPVGCALVRLQSRSGWLTDVQHLLTGKEGKREGHWEVCVRGGRVWSSVQLSTRHESHLIRRWWKREWPLCLPWMHHLTQTHTRRHTHTHTSIPITPFPSLELTSWVMLTGTPLESGGGESKERNGRKERRGEGEKWWKGESWGSSEGWGEWRRENKTERGNRIPQHEAEWSMSPCHLPHTVNGWPPQSCHQRLISAARKWIKGRAERRGGRQKIVEKSFFRRKTHCNLLQFLKTNMTGWNYSATTEAVICKCHKVQV